MSVPPSVLRRGIVRCDEASRCTAALVVGGSIPVVTFLVAASLLGARPDGSGPLRAFGA